MKTPIQILQEAKELLSNPKHWYKGYFASNKFHEEISARSPSAVCWCAWGAIQKVAGDSHLSLSPQESTSEILAFRIKQNSYDCNVAKPNSPSHIRSQKQAVAHPVQQRQ